VAGRPENWRLIAEAAKALTAAGQTPFTRQSVYEWIWRRYSRSEHDRPSLDPTFQGMVKNARGGVPSAGGKPFVRVAHGQFVLADGSASAAAVGEPSAAPRTYEQQPATSPPTEDDVKRAAKDWLEERGFRVTVAWGHEHGIDIRAVGPSGTVILEAKGSASNPAAGQVNFLTALGELLQRMTEPGATYGLVLPDSPKYRGLVDRLPALAWERLGLVVLFVTKTMTGKFLVETVPSTFGGTAADSSDSPSLSA
jgi:hypothetical protein